MNDAHRRKVFECGPGPKRFSIIIPAHNAAGEIGKCLDSLRIAAEPFDGKVEVIVGLERCVDATEEIAMSYGAAVVHEDGWSIARTRNAAAAKAQGDIIVTVDAGSRVSVNTLYEIDRAVAGGRHIGGGVTIELERMSFGIVVSLLLLTPLLLAHDVFGGLFWCLRRDYEALGGFNGKLISGADLDFARRLKALGKQQKKKFRILSGAYIVASCREFSRFSDLQLLCHPLLVWRILRGTDPDVSGRFLDSVKK